MKHTEGPSSILKSRFVRGLFPLVAALLAFALAAPEAQALVYTSELSFPSAPAAALADFPVLVRISSTTPSGFSYEDCPDASHLWFADDGGAALPFEVDTWDANGTSLVWVSVPSLSSSATITMYWASDAANVPDDIPSSSQVWTRAGYNAVWHFSGSAAESVNGLAATANGTPSYNGNASYPGPLGKTLWLDGSSYLSVANDSAWATLGSGSTLTISCWARSIRDSFSECDRMLSCMSNWKDANGFELTVQNSARVITVGSSDSSQMQVTIPTGVNVGWKHLAATYNGTSASLYDNGTVASNATLKAVVTPAQSLAIGANVNGNIRWNGGIDEVRIRAAASTPEWVAAEYAAMTNANYAVFAEAPLLVSDSLSRTGTATYSLSATAASGGADLAWIAANGASTTTNGWTTAAAGGTVNWTVSGLGADTTYRISVLATNENGTAELPAGIVYAGALSFSAASDAYEDGLVAGGVTVSRAYDDPFPLALNYTITGSAGTEGTTWATPVAVTIPANAASAVIPVVPLSDADVDADVTITVTLLAGNYELPSTASTNLVLHNRVAVSKTDFAKKMTLTPSATALAKIGETAWTDFPVLVRLPAEASAQLQSANGTDLFFTDENDASLPFEVETFNPSGTTFVWVKVPSLSASTELTVWFGGASNVDNDPTAVWSRYVGVWHYAPSDAGGSIVADATGHGLTGSTTGALSTYAGPFGGDAIHGTATVTAPNYDALVPNAGQFTASGWFKAPSQVGDYLTFVSKKTGLNWDDAKGWYLEMAQSKTKMNLVLGNSTTSATIPDVSANWNHFSIVSDGTNVKVYMNGSTSAAITKAYAVTASGRDFVISPNKADNCTDEYRIRKGAASATETALEYATMADTAFFDLGAIESVDDTAQVFETPTIVRNDNGTYTVTVVLRENNGDVGAIYDAGATAVTNILATAATPGTFTDTPANLTADTTYKFAAYGKNTNGTEVVAKGGVFYNGDLSIEKISDAVENGLVPGVFRISRADTAHDLVVAYTVGGTAVAGQTYEALSGTATIPAGTNSVDIAVAPLLDSQTTSNTTVTVTLDSGLYGIDAQAGSAEMAVLNLVAPSGYNTWIATSNGLASVGSNWSEGIAPTSSDNILFDGRFSTKNCEWDAAATPTVASWTQNANYTGTITFDTEFPDYAGATFTLFTVTGDCDILGGKWSCRGNYNNFGATVDPMNTTATAKRWCLNVSVGGAMTIASGASVTVTGRGYGYPSSNTGVPAYGGYAYGGTSAPYGSITEPFDPGKGALAQGDQRRKISAIGGGAVKLTVAGNLTLDGSIVALGTADQNIARSGGSGGSIWIAANQISGSGTIDASAPTGIGNDQIVAVGSGGRIALYTQSLLEFPMANVSCNGTGYCGTYWAWNSRVGGPGTIYVKDPTQSHGTLYVKQSTTVSTQNSKWTGTPVMGDLALDAVVLSGRTFLRIPEGASLTLPSLAAVTTDNTGAGQAGLVYDGGTLNIGSGSQTLKANVAFSSPTAFSFPGDLTLETGAKLGSLNSMYGTAANDYDQTFTVSVAGNLTIPADASAGATRCCALTASGKARYAASHGGQSLYLAAEARTNGFDSVLNPSMPGGSANCNFPAGGAFTLTVGGTLTLDGPMTADGGGARGSDSTYDGTSAGAGGTLNITAGALAGGGKMSAEGGCGRSNYAGGAGGGRVAVRLTGNGSTFSDYWKTNITAYGVSFSAGKNEKASSAGTVYLQEKSDGEAAGTVLIRGDYALQRGATNNTCRTLYPGNGDGCDALEALKKTNLAIAGAAKVQLTDTFKIAGLSIENDSLLDLNGKTLTVRSAKVNGVKLTPGTYAAGSTVAIGEGTLADYLVDTAEGAGGALVVSGGGFRLSLR